MTAFVGNTLSKPEVVSWFLIYFMAVGFIVVLVFVRVRLLKILLKLAGPVSLGEMPSFFFPPRVCVRAGMATSQDGLAWQKKGPVFDGGPEGTFDEMGAGRRRIVMHKG